MATRRGVLEKLQGQGATREQMQTVLTGYREKYGAFEDDPKPQNDVAAGVESFNTDPTGSMDPDKKAEVTATIDQETGDTEKLRHAYGEVFGSYHDNAQLVARLEEQYGTGATAGTAIADMESFTNHPQTFHMQGKNPWTFTKLTAGSASRSVLSGLSAVPEMGVRAIGGYGFDRERISATKTRNDFVLGQELDRSLRMEMGPYGLFDPKDGETQIPSVVASMRGSRSRFGKKALDMGEALHDTGRELGEYSEKWYKYGIDPEIQGSWFQKSTQITAEFMQLGLYGIPGAGPAQIASRLVGPAYISGRLFDEAQSEMMQNGHDRERSSAFAIGYVATFGPMEVAVDKLTMGVGSDLIKTIKPKSLLQATLKGMGVTAIESQKAGVGEFVVETVQDATVQFASTGEVNWKQSSEAGLIGYLSAVFGGNVFGSLRTIDSVKATKKIQDLGIDNPKAVEYIDRLTGTEDVAERKQILKELNEDILVARGERIQAIIADKPKVKVPTDERPLTLGDIQAQRKSHNDREIEEIVGAMEPSVQGAARDAFLHPGKRSLEELNKKITELSDRKQEMRPGTATARNERREEQQQAEQDSAQEPIEAIPEDETETENEVAVDPRTEENEVFDGESVPEGTTVDAPIFGELTLRRWYFDDSGQRKELWSGASSAIIVNRNVETGETTQQMTGDGSGVGQVFNQEYNQLQTKIDRERETERVQNAGDKPSITSSSPEADLKAEADRLGITFVGLQKGEVPVAYFRTEINGEMQNISPWGTETVEEALARTTEAFTEGKHIPAPEPDAEPTQPTASQDINPFIGQSTSDLGDYWADSLATGLPLSDNFQNELLSRFDSKDEFNAFRGSVMKRAEVRRKEIEADNQVKSDYQKALFSMRDVTILKSPRAISLYESVAGDLELLMQKFEFRLLPNNEYYRKNAEAYAAKSGMEVDYELNWIGPSSRRARTLEIKEAFAPLVYKGDVAGVEAMLAEKKINPNAVFGSSIRNLVGRVKLAQKIEARENGRAETHKPGRVREDVAPYLAGTPKATQDLGFISPLAEQAKTLTKEVYTPDALLTVTRKINKIGEAQRVAGGELGNKGIKLNEVDDLGLMLWLRDKETVTKAELIDFIEAEGVQLEELVLYHPDDENPNAPDDRLTPEERSIRAAAYEALHLHDGNGDFESDGQTWDNRGIDMYGYILDEHGDIVSEGYPETLAGDLDLGFDPEYFTVEGGGTRHHDWQLPGPKGNYREFILKFPDDLTGRNGIELQRYENEGHYPGVYNAVAHVRVSDRYIDGQKVLLVDEVQSDMKKRHAELKRIIESGKATEEDNNEYYDLNKFGLSGKSTAEIVIMKRMIRVASEGRYDAIAWTGGETQALRWQTPLRQEIISMDWSHDINADERKRTAHDLRNRADAAFSAAKTLQEFGQKKEAALIEEFGGVGEYAIAKHELSKSPLFDLTDPTNAERQELAEIDTEIKRLREPVRLYNEAKEIRKAGDKFLADSARVESIPSKPQLTILRKSGKALVLNYNLETGLITDASESQQMLVGEPIAKLIDEKHATRFRSEKEGHLSGKGIVIGAKGYTDLYNKIIPKAMANLTKQLGGKVEVKDYDPNEHPFDTEDIVPLWYMKLTDEIKKDSLEGYYLYERNAEYHTGNAGPNSGLDLATLEPSMGRVHTVTSLGHLKRNEHYKAAKYEADPASAVELARSYDNKINYDDILLSGAEIIVPIDTLESGSKNAIPYGLSVMIAKRTGLPVAVTAVKEKAQGLTGKDFAGRLSANHEYVVDPSVKGKRVLIVDDNFTSEKTVLAVARAVISAGGTPVLTQTLSASQTGKQLIPTSEQVNLLLSTLGTNYEAFTTEYGFTPTSLTGAQIRRLTVLNRAADKQGNVGSTLRSLASTQRGMREGARDNRSLEEVAGDYAQSIGRIDLQEQVQAELEFLANTDTTEYDETDVSLSGSQRALTKEAMRILREGKKLNKAEIQTLNDALQAGAPISVINQELYESPGMFTWNARNMAITSPADVHAAAMLHRSVTQESAKRLVIDKDGNVLTSEVMTYGSLTSAAFNPKDLLGNLPEGAYGIIVMHNHPSGDPRPSSADRHVTQMLLHAADAVGVRVIDHVITNGTKVFSMRDMSAIKFSEGDSTYEQTRYEDEMYEYEDKVASTPLPEWENVNLGEQAIISTPEQLLVPIRSLRQANPDAGHVILINAGNKLSAVHRIDTSKSQKQIAADVAQILIDSPQAASFFLDLPIDTARAIKVSKKVLQFTGDLGDTNLLDVIDGENLSLRETGVMSFSKPSRGHAGFAEEQGDYNPAEARIVRMHEDAKQLERQFLEQVDAQSLSELTADEASLSMQYVAARQNYDSTLETVDEMDLPLQFAEFLTREGGWIQLSQSISDQITGLREILGINFEAVAGLYFPLRHMVDPQAVETTIADMLESSLGVAKSRKGTFEGVILNPETQVRLYLRDAAKLLTIGQAFAEQLEVVSGMQNEIAAAMHPEAGIEIPVDDSGEPFGPSAEVALSEWETLRQLQAEAEAVGIDVQEVAGTQLYRMIAMLHEDGGGKQVGKIPMPNVDIFKTEDGKLKFEFGMESSRDWANIVDPAFIVQRMDGMEHGKQVDGRMYGANSRLLSDIFQASRLARDAEMESRARQRALLKTYNDEKGYKKINDLLYQVFIGNPELRKEVMRADANQLAAIFGFTRDEANIVHFYAEELKASYADLAYSEDIKSDMAHIARERRQEFSELERKIQEGVATREDVNAYLSFIPENQITGTDANSPKAYAFNSMIRNVARWTFERHAIDSKDFFGYFDSMQSTKAKSDYFGQLYKRVHAWADYLESIDQADNAKWWRHRADNSIKGDMFAFEDKILDTIANLTKKATAKRGDVDGSSTLNGAGSALDALRNASPDQIKARIVEASGVLQRARIYNFLLGNVGWSLATQPTSIALTLKHAGFKGVAKAYHKIIFGEADITESDVTMIKNRREGLAAVEAVSQFENLSVKHGARSRVRILAGYLGEKMETHLSHVSYLAGVTAAQEKYGMDEEDAKIHGEFISATTQSMYDRVNRNTALNSSFLRAWKPMQTFMFTNLSNLLDTVGAVGISRSKLERLRELAQWKLASAFFTALWSAIFGDDLLKALLDPTHNKATVGSHLPVMGDVLDRQVSKLPWRTDKTWQEEGPMDRVARRSLKLAQSYIDGDEHANREAILYGMDYVLPWMGIPGGTMMKNIVKLESARNEYGRLEKVNGDLNRRLYGLDNPGRWAGGVMFGTKALDKPESFAEQQKKKKKAK